MLNVNFSNISRFFCCRGRNQENLNTELVQDVALHTLASSDKVKHLQTRNTDSPYQDYKMKIYLEYGSEIHNAVFNSATLNLPIFY